MRYVIIRWLLMVLCSECVNVIDGKLSFSLNRFVVFKDYVERMFHELLRIFSIKCFAFPQKNL